MNITTNTTFIFCPPTLGKPDPNVPRPAYGPDTRTRILQKGSKGNTCWYAAFNILRDRYKAPNTQSLQGRQFEITASKRRKELTSYECALPDLADQLNNEQLKRILSSITKTSLKTPNIQMALTQLDTFAKEVKLATIIPQFSSQNTYDNIYDYLVYLKFIKRIEINESFLSKSKINAKEQLVALRTIDPSFHRNICAGKSYDEVPLVSKSHFLDYLVRQVSIKAYNLRVSSWTPKDSIESLAKELQDRGPLIVMGVFGIPHYGVPPKKLNRKINDRDIYGWSKSDPKIPGIFTAHAILLVGAEKTEVGQFVYYIDPLDNSDPSHPESQRIYAMSYARLTSPENICDTAGAMRSNTPPGVGYALYKDAPPLFTEENLLEELAFQRQVVNKIGLKSVFTNTENIVFGEHFEFN